MKKFLIFLVAIVVVVCAGLTTYYFLRNDEVINFTTKDIYCNEGDLIPIDQLGLSVRRQDKRTTYNYNAADKATQEAVSFDEKGGCYVANKGGVYAIVISTSNSKYPNFSINVHVGEGSEQFPYYIFNQEDLNLISDRYGLSSYYLLMNDIELTEGFKPIGYQKTVSTGNTYKDFTGSFDGNGHTISNLKLTSENNTDMHNAGLFATVHGATAIVKNLTLENFDISGSFETAGALAGKVYGTVSQVKVKNGSVATDASAAKVGALVGELVKDSLVTKSYAEGVKVAGNGENSEVGGLVGLNTLSSITAVYTNGVTVEGKGTLGGLVGSMEIGTGSTNNDFGTIRQSYAYTESLEEGFKAFVGKIFTKEFDTVTKQETGDLDKQYYANSNLKYLVGNYAIGTEGNLVGYATENSLKDYFEKELNNKLVDEEKGFNFVTAKATINDLASEDKYVYYGFSSTDKIYWDDSIWATPKNKVPTIKDNNSTVSAVSISYINRNIAETPIDDAAKLKEQLNTGITGKNIVLSADKDYNLEGMTVTPKALTNSIIDGKGATIRNFTINGDGTEGLFSSIESSAIKNLTLKEFNFTNKNAANVGAVAGKLTGAGASVESVTVEYTSANIGTTTNFGGVVAEAEEGTIVKGCTVTGLSLETGVDADVVGGVVAIAHAGTTIEGNTVNATLSGRKVVAGLVAQNEGNVRNNRGNVVIKYSESLQDNAKVAGLVAENNGVVENTENVNENNVITKTTPVVNVEISVEATDRAFKAAGIVAENNGTISNIVVNGKGITIGNISSTEVSLAGAVVDNAESGKIENVYLKLDSVGKFVADKNYAVAGLVVNNSGSINQAVVAVDRIEGNTVAGVVVRMVSGSINQVFVGGLNTTASESVKTTSIVRNRIYGDIMVSGVVVGQEGGSITNVQAQSLLEGVKSDTLVSLIALIFPDGAYLENATINSRFTGVGTFYKDTWNNADKDSSWGQKVGLFGQKGEVPAFAYNLYANDAASGTMRSVVVNTTNLADFEYASSKCTRGNFLWIPTSWDMENTAQEKQSFIKDVDYDAFRTESAYKGEVSVEGHFTFELNFNIADSNSNAMWTSSNDGITLRFVNNYIANVLNAAE